MDQKPDQDNSDQAPQLTAGRVACFVNAHSRKGRQQFDSAIAALTAAGFSQLEGHAVENEQEMFRLLRQEIENEASLVIIGGGDGTLSHCADLLAGTTVAMGVLPLGTGNTLARSLGMPLDLEGAAGVLADGHIIAMDVGRVNGQVFLNSVTLGLSSEIASALDGNVKKKLGLLAWPVIGFKIWARHRALHLRVTSPERSYRVRTHQLVVANGRYIAGPIASSPEAAVNDHTLDVFVLGRGDKKSLISAAWQWLAGRHVQQPESRFFHTRSVRIESLRGPVPANVDGEINEITPLDISIEAGVLHVAVPRGFDARNV